MGRALKQRAVFCALDAHCTPLLLAYPPVSPLQDEGELALIQQVFTDEMMTTIFGRLGPYALGQAACVCRQWRFLARVRGPRGCCLQCWMSSDAACGWFGACGLGLVAVLGDCSVCLPCLARRHSQHTWDHACALLNGSTNQPTPQTPRTPSSGRRQPGRRCRRRRTETSPRRRSTRCWRRSTGALRGCKATAAQRMAYR